MLFYIQTNPGYIVGGVHPPSHEAAGQIWFAESPADAKHFGSIGEAHVWASGGGNDRIWRDHTGRRRVGGFNRAYYMVREYRGGEEAQFVTSLLPAGVLAAWSPVPENIGAFPLIHAWDVPGRSTPVMDADQLRMVSCAPRAYGVGRMRISDRCRADDPEACGCTREDLKLVDTVEVVCGKAWIPMGGVVFTAPRRGALNVSVVRACIGWECSMIDWLSMTRVTIEK